jgi:uncharacterized membrane protein
LKIAIKPLRARWQPLYDESSSQCGAIYVESLAKTLLSDRIARHYPYLGDDPYFEDAFLDRRCDHYVPGLGIVTLILLVFLTGLLTANFIGKQIVKLWEGWLNRVPLVRGIYSTLKSMMDILSFSERGSYHRVVLIQFPKNGHYCFAFVTGVTKGDMQDLAQEPLVHVYVPTSPNPTSGYFLIVPEREVTAVNISVEEAMKLIVSGGLYSPSPSLAPSDPEARWGDSVKQPEAGVPIG